MEILSQISSKKRDTDIGFTILVFRDLCLTGQCSAEFYRKVNGRGSYLDGIGDLMVNLIEREILILDLLPLCSEAFVLLTSAVLNFTER